jgi:aminopeptidase N
MENVGAVTFTEHYIYRDTPTQGQRLQRADTVLHEMAHMWFGNLVSPQWWNCLWLNESFATYMAALSVASATRFGALSWQEFNSGMKAWAYREDQLSTTHPIEGPVDDTDQTFLNFDGVTYGKGSAVLKQLVQLVSMDGFKAAMRYYFQKYKWGNTVIGNFLEAIEHGAKSVGVNFNPTEWSKMVRAFAC